ncbi:MAG: outer membrane protein transport protein, partial [Deltaproteobacteria bacterium]|nr:outer membrane protein transport protein [Deltaproteobacteria bacterium]
PHMYYTHRISDRFTFGVGEFTRYGLGFEYPHNWPGRFNIYEVSLKSASVNPNIAWAVTDKLSLAAGAEIVYVNLDLKRRALVESDVAGLYSFEVDSNIQKASDTGLGWDAAMHYQFNDRWAFGFLYRSRVRVHAKGEVEYTMMHYQGVPVPGLKDQVEAGYKENFRDGKAHSMVILPDSFSAGMAFSPLPELSFEFAATYTRWSSFRDLNIHVPQPVGVSTSHKHWKDVWRLGFGIEYSPLDWLTLRAGYVFDESPMPTGNNQDYLVPTNDRNIWSLGLGFRWDSWTVDLAYAFIDAKARIYHENTETGVLRSRTHESNATHIGSVSLGYRF